MRNHLILSMLLYFFCPCLFSQTLILCNGIENMGVPRHLQLFKQHSVFDNELISNFELRDSIAIIRPSIDIDVYFIKDPGTKQMLFFIWDDDLKIYLKERQLFYLSNIDGSTLTNKWKELNSKIDLTFGKPYRKIDSLLNQNRNSHNLRKEEEEVLIKQKDSLFVAGGEEIRRKQKEYIESNPNSFLSLMYLTSSGYEAEESENIILFEFLSKKLKQHNRAIKTYSR